MSALIDDDLDQLRERLLAAGWPASPNGRGLYARCPACGEQTVLVERVERGTPRVATRCAAGCSIHSTQLGLAALVDLKAAEMYPTPRWQYAGDDPAATVFAAMRPQSAETDVGNAQRFALDWGGDELRHVAGSWYVWDGRRHRRDDDGAAMRRAVTTARLIVEESKPLRETAEALAGAAGDGDAKAEAKKAAKTADRRLTWAMTSQAAPRLKACLEIARTDPRLIASTDDLDSDPWALCVGTGILDLRTGELRPHSRAELHTRLVPIAYEPDATCPRFEQFLATVMQGDAELIAWLQKAVGYTITGDTREQALLVLHGDGANGKSTLLNVLVGMLGEHAVTADSRTFTLAGADRAARSDLARLRGRRLVVASEVPRGSQLDEDLVKRITGGERITARFNRMDEFEFTPTFKVWLGVNHLPVVHGDDHAIWRHLRIVPFRHRVEQPDLELGRRLHAELPGILAWAIRGCTRWQAEGLGSCGAVDAATDAYRREQDQVARFVEECCTRDASATARNADLHNAYTAWANAHELLVIAPRELGNALSRLGFATGKSNGHRVRKGLSL